MNKEFTYIEEFINHIDVICPLCNAKANVISNPTDRKETRFTCLTCGQSKNWTGNSGILYNSSNFIGYEGILIGKPVDCYFKIPLWYSIGIKGEILFAYNKNHLEYLENYISDKLRQRKSNEHGWSNNSLESRLPKWMLLSKNREYIRKKIIELKNKS
jgi:hypothetical protein